MRTASLHVSGGAAGAVHLHRVLPGDFAAEARGIARVITDLRAVQPAASIAILLSARTHAAPIVAALEARQIAVVGVDLVSLAQLSIVRDLTALTQALDHLGDRHGVARDSARALVRSDAQADRPDRGRGAWRDGVWQRLCDPQVHALLAPEAQERVQRLVQILAVSFDEACRLCRGPRGAGAARGIRLAAAGRTCGLRAGR